MRRAGTAVLAAGLLGSACASHRIPVGWVPPEGTTATGIASWYGPGFHGRKTANGERFDQEGLTAAHRLWAFGTRVRVTLFSTGRTVEVRINDRLPRKDRVIDLSKGAARRVGLIGPGIGRVRLEVIESPRRKVRTASVPRPVAPARPAARVVSSGTATPGAARVALRVSRPPQTPPPAGGATSD